MVRLSVVTCAVVYAALVVVSERAPDDAGQTRTDAARRASNGIADSPKELMTADGRRLAVVLAIEPGQAAETPGQITLIQTPHRAQTVMAASAPPPTSQSTPLGEVTGAAVNLRAGPSTRDPILASLIRGDRVEVIGATDNGWALIRAVSTGVEGFMAARFLMPLN
jgi:uncharacterized protein YgiM (DUF1202 family)